MLRTVIFITFYLILCTTVGAQGFGAPGAYWKYDFRLFWDIGEIGMYYEKDTVVQGESCQQFKLHRVGRLKYPQGDPQYYSYYTELYFREEGEKLYNFKPLVHYDYWEVVYDFELVPGQGWGMVVYYDTDSLLATVLDTGRMEVQGREIQWQAVEYNYNHHSKRDTIFKGIGTKKFFILPWDYFAGLTDGHVGGDFICYSDDSIRLPIADQACDPLSSQSEVPITKFTIFPNPIDDLLFISPFSKDAYHASQIEIYDLQGRRVWRGDFQLNMDMSFLNSGTYFLHLITPGSPPSIYSITKL